MYVCQRPRAVRAPMPARPLLSEHQRAHADSDAAATCIAFVDDALLLAQCDNNELLEHRVTDLAATTCSILAYCDFRPNY